MRASATSRYTRSQSTGFEARGFADGDSFWDALQKEAPPELVVLDVMLPGMDGIELLRRHARAARALPSIPVVMATAKGAEYDKIQGLDLGADYYLDEALRRDGAGLLRQGGAAPQPVRRRRSALLRSGGAARRSGRAHRHGGRRARGADVQGI